MPFAPNSAADRIHVRQRDIILLSPKRGADLNLSNDLQIAVVPTSQIDQATKDEIIALCIRAFQQHEFVEMFDLVESAIDSTHVLARIDGKLIGHAVWSTRQLYLEDGDALKTAYVDAVATDPTFQRRGIGSATITRLGEEIRDYDIGCLHTNRVSFYAQSGWELWTGPKGVKSEHGVDFTADENVMIWRTAHTPPLDKDSPLIIEWRRGAPW